MTSQLIRMAVGKVNLKSATASYAILKVDKPFNRNSAVLTGRRVARSETVDNVSAFPKINGIMTTYDVTHENGTIMMIQANKTRGSLRLADATILLRLREEAANLNVIAHLPIGPESLLGNKYSVFRGRADILSPDEARVFGITIPGSYVRNFFDPDEVQEMFEIHEVDPERAPRPDVALVSTSTGIVVREIQQAPRRRMNFRK